MRTLFLFLSATILFTQCEVKKNVSCDIQISEEAEVPQKMKTEQEIEKELELKFSFITIEEFEYNIDGKKGSIVLEKLKDWNDPGDYHRIRIVGDTSYSFFNVDGWMEMDVSYSSIDNRLESKYVILEKSNKRCLLYAFGYPYASEPELLTILNLNKKVDLIFNNNYFIYKYQMDNVCPFIIIGDYDYDGKKRLDTIIFKDNRFYKSKHE